MGLFDWFRRRARASAPTSVDAPPKVPFIATIESFELGSGVGSLSGGVKFGRSACRGFEPIVGLSVEVVAVDAHPLGGWKATEISLKSDAASYDAALVARDQSLGIRRPQLDPVTQAAETSEVLGWVVVLLNEAPPTGPAAFAEWAQRIGLQAAGIRVSTDGAIRLGVGKHDALAFVGPGPYPADRAAGFGVSDDFDCGQGFIGLGIGMRTGPLLSRSLDPSFDPWAPDGILRDLSKIARELSKHGPAVLLMAGSAVEAERFRELLGDLDDPTSKPFGAWLATSMDSSRMIYSTYGMTLHGLPDVEAAYTSDDPWELDRLREALHVACSTMVHTNRELEVGSRLQVAVGQSVGSHALTQEEGDAETYVVSRSEHGLVLTRETDIRSRWPSVGLNTYQSLVDRAFAARFNGWSFASMTPSVGDDMQPFRLEVWETNEGGGYFMATNGVGRVAQKFGSAEQRNERIELVAAMKAHHPVIANLIATVALHVHLQADEGGVFKVGDTVGIELKETGAAGFVLADAGAMKVADGPPINLLELVPLTKAEYEAARSRGSGEIRGQLGKMSPEARAERWRLKFAN